MNVSLAPPLVAPTADDKRLLALTRACGASCVMVTLAIAVEALVMFAIQPNTFRKSLGASVVSFDLAANGKLSAVVYSHSIFDSFDRPDFSLATRDSETAASVFRVLPSKARPKCVAGHPSLPRFYVGAWDGVIFAVDLAGQGATCRRVGQHPENFITQMRCSPDGNFVVATGYKITAAWNVQSGELLWQTQHNIFCLAFAAQAPRLFCGLKGGAIVELDPERGVILTTIPAQASHLVAISVSPRGEHVATVTTAGHLALIHVASCSVVWSARQAIGVCPTFLDDGNYLLTAEHVQREESLVLRDVASGQQIASLRPDTRISRIVSRGGQTFHAWGMEGPVRMWHIQGKAGRTVIVPSGLASTS